MSDKQELQKLVKRYRTARIEAQALVNKATKEVEQARQEQREQSNRQT